MEDEAGIRSSAAFSTSASNGATPTEDSPVPSNGEDTQMSWKLARKALIRTGSPAAAANGDSGIGGGSLEGAGAELCITLLERGLNFSGLKARLKAADQEWMEHFITMGGIPALFDALEALGKKGFSGIVGAIRQLECVACVRAVMNNRFGLEFIIEDRGESFVKRLTDGKTSLEGCRASPRCYILLRAQLSLPQGPCMLSVFTRCVYIDAETLAEHPQSLSSGQALPNKFLLFSSVGHKQRSGQNPSV